jgi:hypothetical protein
VPTSSAARISAGGWRIVLLASLGGTLEFYDFVIFGIFAKDIADAIFPNPTPLISLMVSFAAFAAGYLARPAGGIVLSHFGDRYGRRRVFLISIFVMSGATLGMGLVPSFATWGAAASVLMVALRLVQGFCLGGELPGALTYVVETAPLRAPFVPIPGPQTRALFDRADHLGRCDGLHAAKVERTFAQKTRAAATAVPVLSRDSPAHPGARPGAGRAAVRSPRHHRPDAQRAGGIPPGHTRRTCPDTTRHRHLRMGDLYPPAARRIRPLGQARRPTACHARRRAPDRPLRHRVERPGGDYGRVRKDYRFPKCRPRQSPRTTQLLHAVGLALAAKIRKTGQVALTMMGEGSSNQGDVHEGLNFAAIHKLPFVFVVENNGYAISVPLARQVAGSSVAGRAAGYGIPGVMVDGSDVLACYAAARDAVARARAGEGPSLIEAKVMRLTAHSSDDQQTKYRSEEELAAEKSLDPVPMFRAQLAAAGILDDAAEARIRASIAAAVEDATDYAESQPDPQASTAMKWVYAEDWPSETPPPWGMGDEGGD